VLACSLAPHSPLELIPHSRDGGLEHALAYGVLTLSLLATLPARLWPLVCALVFALGAGLEFVQHYLPDRHPDRGDIACNGLGILAAWTLAGLTAASLPLAPVAGLTGRGRRPPPRPRTTPRP